MQTPNSKRRGTGVVPEFLAAARKGKLPRRPENLGAPARGTGDGQGAQERKVTRLKKARAREVGAKILRN